MWRFVPVSNIEDRRVVRNYAYDAATRKNTLVGHIDAAFEAEQQAVARRWRWVENRAATPFFLVSSGIRKEIFVNRDGTGLWNRPENKNNVEGRWLNSGRRNSKA